MQDAKNVEWWVLRVDGSCCNGIIFSIPVPNTTTIGLNFGQIEFILAIFVFNANFEILLVKVVQQLFLDGNGAMFGFASKSIPQNSCFCW